MTKYLLLIIQVKTRLLLLLLLLILDHREEVNIAPDVVFLGDVLPPPFAPAIISPYSVSNR